MRHVNLNATIGELTGVLDPRPYLNRLAELADDLPEGAHAFATDPDHYDFGGQRCVKDLKLQSVTSTEIDGGQCVDLGFRHNCWKHEKDLIIHYRGVESFHLDPADWAEFGDLILDEILPHSHGCSHEIAFRAGTITTVSRDLTATWIDTDCPDKPPGQTS